MPKRITVEVDEELLAKAKRLLALRTTRETIQSHFVESWQKKKRGSPRELKERTSPV